MSETRKSLALHWQILIAMVIGAALGLTLNATVGEATSVTQLGPDRYLRVIDTPNRVDIRIEKEDGALEKRWVVDPMRRNLPDSLPSLDKLEEKEPKTYALFHEHGRSWARFIGDLGGGIGSLFLRLLKMVAVPLIITSLMTGITGLASATRLGRMFGRTISYYLATSAIACVTGLLLVNMIRPGHDPDMGAQTTQLENIGGDNIGSLLYKQVETMIPENPLHAAANADFLSIIAFSLAFGIFTILVGGKTLEVIHSLFEAAFHVMMAMTMAIIKLAPIGVFGLILYATATQGIEVFKVLGWYMITVICGLFVHACITLPLIVRFVAQRNPLQYAQALSPALFTAFSSASSNATLPLTMSCVEERAGVPNSVGSFVLPLGATINMDGTALYEVIAVLFIAQMEPGTLTFTTQIMVVITALLASIGAAGIPHAGLVMMVIVLAAVGLPAEKVGIILAVDRILDMGRTATNVWSDACGCAVVARFEPKEEEVMHEKPAEAVKPDEVKEPNEADKEAKSSASDQKETDA